MTPETSNATLTEELTISQIFGLSADFKLDDTAASEAPNIKDLKKKIPPAVSWSAAQTEVSTSLSNTLHTGVLETLAQGWMRYHALMDDAHKSRNAPQNPILSTLAHHDIESTLRPYVEIFIGPTSIQRIPFAVTLTTTIDGLQLGLLNGKIVFVEMAQCEWKGSIATNSVTLIERHTEPLHLPGRIQLKRPIPLIRD
jgi:hypothetical protein